MLRRSRRVDYSALPEPAPLTLRCQSGRGSRSVAPIRLGVDAKDRPVLATIWRSDEPPGWAVSLARYETARWRLVESGWLFHDHTGVRSVDSDRAFARGTRLFLPGAVWPTSAAARAAAVAWAAQVGLTRSGASGSRATREVCLPAAGAFGSGLPGSVCVRVTRTTLPVGVPKGPVDRPDRLVALATALSEAYQASNREFFLVLVLDARLQLWGWYTTAVGGNNSVQVEVPLILQPLVASGRTKFAIVHNHPSGDPSPSPEDKALTQRLQRASELVGVQLLDHLVVGEGGRYYSFREHGLL